MDLTRYVRDVLDFPVPGVVFKDITPLVGDPAAFRYTVDRLAERTTGWGWTKICAAEARGFLFAAAMAYKLGVGVVPIRKPGKLPWKTISARYELEYGHAELFLHEDALAPGERVLLLDDLLATGGTSGAMIELVERTGAVVAGLAFVVELDFLHGREKLTKYPVDSLIHVSGE